MDWDTLLKFINTVGLPTTFLIAVCVAYFYERKQNVALQAQILEMSNNQSASMARIDAMLALLTAKKSR